MIYVSSDWHGWPVSKIKQLLERAGFGDDDFLFVLGDVIDRGENGVELLRWLAMQTNVQLLLGNHEAMLLSCKYVFEEISEESLNALNTQKLTLLQTWLENGGGPTLRDMNYLQKENPDEFEGLLDYLKDAPLYETVEINGSVFVLVHAGLENFSVNKPLDRYEPHDFLWARPNLDTRYFDKATVVFGHTPTLFYGETYKGKPVTTDTWICIDTGAACGLSPVLLRLDDRKVFY